MEWSEWKIKNYGPLGMTVDDILNQPDSSSSKKFASLLYRIDLKPNYESFTHTERIIREVWFLFGEVGNGGFDQYFSNGDGDCAKIALSGLKEIGADDAASVMSRAMSIFPNGDPFSDESQALEELDIDSYQILQDCDKEMWNLENKTSELVLEYARKRKAEIHLP